MPTSVLRDPAGATPREGDAVPRLRHQRLNRPSRDLSRFQPRYRAPWHRPEDHHSECRVVRTGRVRTLSGNQMWRVSLMVSAYGTQLEEAQWARVVRTYRVYRSVGEGEGEEVGEGADANGDVAHTAGRTRIRTRQRHLHLRLLSVFSRARTRRACDRRQDPQCYLCRRHER